LFSAFIAWPEPTAPVRSQHLPGLLRQQPRHNRSATPRQMRRERPRHQAQRPCQDVRQHQVIRPPRPHCPITPTIRAPAAQHRADAVEHGVLPRDAYRPWLDVRRPYAPVQQPRRRHRQNAGPGPQVQNAPRPAIRHALQRTQTAAGRAVLAGPERERGIECQTDSPRRHRPNKMRAAHHETAADHLLRECGTGACEPTIRGDCDAARLWVYPSQGGRQRQRRNQRRVALTRRLDAFHPPPRAGGIAEEPDGRAHAAQRGLEHFQRRLRHLDTDGLERGRTDPHPVCPLVDDCRRPATSAPAACHSPGVDVAPERTHVAEVDGPDPRA